MAAPEVATKRPNLRVSWSEPIFQELSLRFGVGVLEQSEDEHGSLDPAGATATEGDQAAAVFA